MEIGLDGAVPVICAKVWLEHCGVHKGRCQACWDAAKEDRALGRIDTYWEGSNREQWFLFVRGVVALVWADND